jgi:hypothetical protein
MVSRGIDARVRSDFTSVVREHMRDLVLLGEAETVYEWIRTGKLCLDRKAFLARARALGAKVLDEDFFLEGEREEDHLNTNEEETACDWNYHMAWDDACLHATNDVDVPGLVLSVLSTSKERIAALSALYEPRPEEPGEILTSGQLFSLAPTGNPHQPHKLLSIGEVSTPLIRENYAEDVLDLYDHVVEDFRSVDPCGRLVLLRGPTGSGKTYLWQALLSELPMALFVKVQAHLVSHLADPNFLPMLVKVRAQHSRAVAKAQRAARRRNGTSCPQKGPFRRAVAYDADGDEVDSVEISPPAAESPIVIVVEDADTAIVSRSIDNYREVAALLSMGDGAEGRAFNLRVVLTTNTDREKLDEAIVRDQRLCSDIYVGKIPAEQARCVLARLLQERAQGKRAEAGKSVGPEEVLHTLAALRESEFGRPAFSGPVTLAEVYSAARPKRRGGRTNARGANGHGTHPVGFDTPQR